MHAGVHPTIAGVILGLLTPVRSWFGYEGFRKETEQALDSLRRALFGESLAYEFKPHPLNRNGSAEGRQPVRRKL